MILRNMFLSLNFRFDKDIFTRTRISFEPVKEKHFIYQTKGGEILHDVKSLRQDTYIRQSVTEIIDPVRWAIIITLYRTWGKQRG